MALVAGSPRAISFNRLLGFPLYNFLETFRGLPWFLNELLWLTGHLETISLPLGLLIKAFVVITALLNLTTMNFIDKNAAVLVSNQILYFQQLVFLILPLFLR